MIALLQFAEPTSPRCYNIREVLTMDYKDFIHSDSRIMLGKPVIKGTRITVEHILSELTAGMEISEIVEAHPSLDKEKVRAAIAYALDVLRNEDVYSLAEKK